MKHPRKEVSSHSPYSGRRCSITGRDIQSGDTIIVCPDTDIAYLEHAFREHLEHTGSCPACKKEAMIPPPITAKPPPRTTPAPEYIPPTSPRSGMGMAQVALVAGGVALLTICVVLAALMGSGILTNNTASNNNAQSGNASEDNPVPPGEVVTVEVTQPPVPTDPPPSEPTPEPQVIREEVTVVVTQPPEPTDPPPPTQRPSVAQPSILARNSWGAAAPGGGMVRHTPERIVFTHEGGSRCCDGIDPASRIRGNQGVHMDNVGWPDLAFHYIVAPNGTIYDGRNDDFQSNSSYAQINSGYQLDGTLVVGILGNYDIQNPTSASLAAAEELIAWLCQEYDISPDQVYYFRDLAPNDVSGGPTTSPGDNMPGIRQFRNNIEAILGG